MFKTFIKKNLAKMAVLALIINAFAPMIQPAQAGDINLKVGANLLGVTMEVNNINNPNLFQEESDAFAPPNQNGFYVSPNIPNAQTEPYTFLFDDMPGYTIEITTNGQAVNAVLGNGRWSFGMQALPDGANMTVLANYQPQQPPGDGAVDIHVRTQDEQENVLNEDYSYNGGAFTATPDVFTEDLNNLVTPKNITFANKPGYLTPGTVTLQNQRINVLPTNVEIYRNIFGSDYILGTLLSENDTLIIVGTYVVEPPNQQATINVGVNAPNGFPGANINISNGIANEVLANQENKNYLVPAGNGEDYTVTCAQVANFTLTTNPHPVQINNIANGQQVNVVCNYVDAVATQATINVSVSGPNNLVNGGVSITPNIANNVAIANGANQDFLVPASGTEDYTVTCQDIAGFDIVSNNPTQLNNLVDGGNYFVSCQYVAEPVLNQATINVGVNGPNGLAGANINISNGIADQFMANQANQNFVVPAGLGQDYTVTCQNNIPNFTLSTNPHPVQINNIANGQQVNVVCNYVSAALSTATIRVNVDGLDNNMNADVEVDPGNQNASINEGASHDFQVDANGALDYTVTCEDNINGFDLITNNPVQVNNIQANSIVEVNCTYVDEEDTATIRVNVDGLDNNMEAEVDISGGIANNFEIEEGDFEDFEVPANGALDYTVTCEENINGFDLVTNNPVNVNNIQPGSTVNVNCTYTDDDENEGTIRVRVNGLDNNMEAQVEVDPGNNIESIEEGSSFDFQLPSGLGQDYTVTCEDNIPGFDLVGNNPIAVNNLNNGATVNVNCNYEDENGGDEDGTIRVHVNGLDNNMEAEVDITPGVANNFEIEEGDFEDFDVEAGEGQDYTVTCQNNINGFDLTSNNSINVNNIAEGVTVNVYCNYEEDDDDNNNDDEATIHISVEGPDSLDEVEVDVPGEKNNIEIQNGDTEELDVQEGDDYEVFCNDVDGFIMVSDDPIEVNNASGDEFVTCEYEEIVKVEKEITNEQLLSNGTKRVDYEVTVTLHEDYTGSSLAVVLDDTINNNNRTINGSNGGYMRVVQVNGDYSDCNISNCDDLTEEPVEFTLKNNGIEKVEITYQTLTNNLSIPSNESSTFKNTASVSYTHSGTKITNQSEASFTVGEDEDEDNNNEDEGFVIEVTPLDVSTSPGAQVTVNISATNESGSTVTGVMLTHDYDQSKLRVLDADGASNDGNKLTWDLGMMADGEVQEFQVRFQVTGQAGEVAQNNTRALLNEFGAVDDVDNFVRIAAAGSSNGGGTSYVYPPTLYKSGNGLLLTLLFSGLATGTYFLARNRFNFSRKLKTAQGQA